MILCFLNLFCVSLYVLYQCLFALVACSIYTGSPVSAARSRSDAALQLQVPLLPVGEQGCHAVLVRHVFIRLLSHRTRATSGSPCCGALTRGVLPPCIAWCSCALFSHRGRATFRSSCCDAMNTGVTQVGPPCSYPPCSRRGGAPIPGAPAAMR